MALAATKSSVSAPASASSNGGNDTGAALIRGIAAYRRHPYHRALADPPVVWAQGQSRLLDYGGTGPAVLVVPSLVNRAYVLDLMEGHSMLRHWAAGGVRPLLLDWGWPGPAERAMDLAGYVAGRLAQALDAVPGQVLLAGYCMGGLLALALALLRPERVAGLVLLATPWDFHAAGPPPHGLATLQAMAAGEALPVDALQAAFMMQDAEGIAAKFRRFGTLDQASQAARRFVAVEDWLSDGVPLAGPVARECLAGWYGANTPALGQWQVGGLIVDPAALAVPSLVALPAQDRIVPPASAAALAQRLPGASVLRPAAGHVGMVAGRNARAALWDPALDWLRSRQPPI